MADRQLALMLDDGTVIHDPSWRCPADIMYGFHGFAVRKAVGVIVDAETLIQVYPPVTQPPDQETAAGTSPVLG